MTTNTKTQQIIDELVACGHYTQEAFAQQIVGETITAILATDHRHAVFTTFDRAAIDGATSRIIEQVRNHWNFK